MNRLNVVAGVALALTSIVAVAQDAARTVQYHSQDIVPIHAKVKYTTLIVVPASEKPQATRTSGLWMWLGTSASCIRPSQVSAPT